MKKKSAVPYPKLDPAPPAGVQVYFMNDYGSPCEPHLAHIYTWDRAETWYKIAKAPVVEEAVKPSSVSGMFG